LKNTLDSVKNNCRLIKVTKWAVKFVKMLFSGHLALLMLQALSLDAKDPSPTLLNLVFDTLIILNYSCCSAAAAD
jgi:hypothetical protein